MIVKKRTTTYLLRQMNSTLDNTILGMGRANFSSLGSGFGFFDYARVGFLDFSSGQGILNSGSLRVQVFFKIVHICA